ncbi:MAG TPA: CorA family divalent cation transporter, partial [Candidatus Aquilonibacter sp.]|nr:CorA family divalent cation transporter [Candidatus Aquilonibacter sp.]
MSTSATCVIYDGHKTPRALTDLSKISEEIKDPWAFMWFDIVAPKADDLQLLKDEFELHPLAIEDAVASHQRSKIESYENYWFLVVHGVLENGDGISVHEIAIFAGRQFLITVRSEPAYPLDEIVRRWEHQPESLERNSGALLYAILDTLVDGYWPAAETLEERVGDLETTLFEEGVRTRAALIEIFDMKKTIHHFRRAVLPMREILIAVQRNDLGIL